MERTLKKTSKNKLARVYALALYDAAVEKEVLQKVWKDVCALQNLLKEDASLLVYLSSPLWEEKDKEDVLQKVAKVLKLDNETLNCLRIVSQNHRIGSLNLVLEDFKRVYYQRNNVVEAVVETVGPLSVEQDKKLKVALERILTKEVVVNYQINPSILGGLRIKCASEMFDDSLNAKLNYLEKLMKGK